MNFKTWIGIKGLQQKEVAAQMGLSPSYLSEILTGKRRATTAFARRIEDFTQGEVTRMEVLYPGDAALPGGNAEPPLAQFSPKGSPLTETLRLKVLAESDRSNKS